MTPFGINCGTGIQPAIGGNIPLSHSLSLTLSLSHSHTHQRKALNSEVQPIQTPNQTCQWLPRGRTRVSTSIPCLVFVSMRLHMRTCSVSNRPVLHLCVCVCLQGSSTFVCVLSPFQVALTCSVHPTVRLRKTSQSLTACVPPPLSPLVLTLSVCPSVRLSVCLLLSPRSTSHSVSCDLQCVCLCVYVLQMQNNTKKITSTAQFKNK